MILPSPEEEGEGCGLRVSFSEADISIPCIRAAMNSNVTPACYWGDRLLLTAEFGWAI